MDKAQKKRLKNLGKEIAERQSRELREALSQTNPAPFGSDQYLRNEIELRKREKQIRSTPAKAQQLNKIEQDYVLLSMHKDPAHSGFGLDQYWLCQDCKYLVSSEPAEPEQCQCGNLYIEPLQLTPKFGENGRIIAIDRVSAFNAKNPPSVELVKLLPKVRKKPWWQFWN